MTAANDLSEAAATWLIRLEGQTSPQMWDEFQAWLEADGRHEAAFIRLRTAWTHCDRFKFLRPTDGRIDRNLLAQSGAGQSSVEEREHRVPLMDRRRWLIAAGVTAVAGASVGSLRWLSTGGQEWLHYETEVGGSRKAVLPDRSLVLLNTDSSVRVRLSSVRRDSELVRGEALFTVAHDRQRPFYVKATGTLVCAMGTKFSVRIHEDRRVEVLVAQGRVAITAANAVAKPAPAALKAAASHASTNESALIGPDSVVIEAHPADYVARRLAWTAGRIAFDGGETLAEAVREFNRYNRRHLVIADPGIAQVRVGGIFDATDPESFVAALEKPFGVHSAPAAKGDDDVIRLIGNDQRMPPRT